MGQKKAEEKDAFVVDGMVEMKVPKLVEKKVFVAAETKAADSDEF
jgi:hypothetical protein